MDILESLVSDIKKSKEQPKQQPKAQARPIPRQRGIVKSGPGGIIFDFGGQTGNSLVDSYNAHLQRHADPIQVQTAQQQTADFAKALNEYVDVGEHEYSARHLEQGGTESVHKAWNQQLSGSTDKAVVEAFNKGELTCDEGQTTPNGQFNLPKGEFSKSKIKMGGEHIQATSETDAALIEMMKSGAFDEESNME